MKKTLFSLLISLCLAVVLLPTSAEASSYTLTEVNKIDTVRSPTLINVDTEESSPLAYTVPDGGATVLYFYNTSCMNCQDTFTALNEQAWVHNDRVNFYAIESTDHTCEDIRAFRAKYAPNITDVFTWLDSKGSLLCYDYIYASGLDPNAWSWPAVVVCTEENGVKTIHSAQTSATDIRHLGNTLENLLDENLGIPKPVPLTISVVEDHDKANEALVLINQYREEQGLPPMQPNKKLTELAMQRAAELRISRSEVRPDGTDTTELLWENLPNISVGNGTTTILQDTNTPEDFLFDITYTGTKRAILLNKSYTQCGVGCIQWGSSYLWAIMATDDNGYNEAPDQSGQIEAIHTTPAYLDCLNSPGLAPDEIILYPQDSTELGLFGNTKNSSIRLIPTFCESEVMDTNGQVIATAALQDNGNILVTAKTVGVGELRVYAWEGQTDPYTATVTVSDDSQYKPRAVHTTINGNGEILLSPDAALPNEKIEMTLIPDEGWWAGDVSAKDANGDYVRCYETGDNQYEFYMPQTDVCLTADFLPDSVPQTRFVVTNQISGHGRLSYIGGVYATTTVTVVPTGEEDHVFKSLTAADAEGNPVALTANPDGSFSFQMPASKVTLYAIFGPPEGYTVTVNRNFYCTITASHKTADPGEAVTISVIPESGRKVKEFQINLQKDEYTWVDENTLTFLMPAHDVEFSVKSLQSAITNPFTDVGESDWFYNPVLWAVENKVTGGMTETTFGPNVSCTRAQVVTFLYAAAGKPEVKADSEPFDDVSASDWFYTPVLWAVENGITGGTSETTFGPNVSCTRAQVVTFLYAAAGKPEITAGSDFADVGDTDWYAKPVIWAKANDITGGISPTEFGPNNICTRAQVVTFLNKASLVK